MKDLMEKALVVLVILAFIIVMMAFAFVVVDTAFKRQAEHECLTWQDQAKEFPSFYLLPWQKEQCDSFGIMIDAPVKYEGHE